MKAALTATDKALERYVAEVNSHALLTSEEEDHLARHYRDSGDVRAAHRLVAANLRFVVKVAYEYRGYDVPLLDLIQEGNIGLTLAVKRFDPDRGCRLISYAVWWIRAYMGGYVMRSWSLVKVGTTQAQRKLFFKLRSQREQASREAAPETSVSDADLARRLGVQESDIVEMASRLATRDLSLDLPRSDSSGRTPLGSLHEVQDSCEGAVQRRQVQRFVRAHVGRAMDELNEKQQYIVKNRLLALEPQTLQSIGSHFNISRERARQIESDVLRKLRDRFRETGLDAAA